MAETRAYRSGREYQELLDFICRLPSQSAYNGFLLHTQNPGITYVATARQWRERFHRRIRDGSRPLVVMIPFGPVGFMYDVADTTGRPLPETVTNPFLTRGVVDTVLWDMTIGNCARDLIQVVDISMHTNSAGSIGPPEPGDKVWAVTAKVRKARTYGPRSRLLTGCATTIPIFRRRDTRR